MKYTNFDEFNFRQSVDKAIKKVYAILGTEKHPRLAEDDLDHKYDDKYGLAEFVTNTSLAAQLTILEKLGMTPEHIQTVTKWVQDDKETVTMQFQAQDGCSFLKEQEVEVVTSETQTETTTQHTSQSTFFGTSGGNWSDSKKNRVIQKIKEYHWKVHVTYHIKLYKGNDPSTAIELQSRNASTVIVTSGGQATARRGGTIHKPVPPIADKTLHPATDVQLTWLFQALEMHSNSNDSEGASTTAPKSQFSIDRAQKSCKTPRRNQQVQAAYEFHQSLVHWMLVVLNFFLDRLEKEILAKHSPIKTVSDPSKLEIGARCLMVGLEKDPAFNHKLVVVREYIVSADRYRVEPLNAADNLPASLTIKKTNLKLDVSVTVGPMLSSVSVEDVFVPILPLLENGSVLAEADANALLEAQNQSIQKAFEHQINKIFPPRTLAKLASQAEAMILLLCTHWLDLIENYQMGINYVEQLLRKQLIQAIGKEVHSQDFDQFMRFHFRKLFGAHYAPKPFTYAVRRPNHYPDGLVSIESTTLGKNGKIQSIETMVRQVSGRDSPSIFIPINAATSIEMTGNRYLHGWMQHRFDSSSDDNDNASAEYRLVARARQFSSFLLIVGTMAGADEFDPKAAIILQNKDEVIIPLLTNVLPTAQEFKDAIASLSPEQQAFCRAFRGMQLESSVFGICIVQLKPQLEALLGLPAGALTKEIQLTQDLMSLFMEYQIPSDLLSCEGDEGLDSGASKLASVKSHVKSVMDVIVAEKEKQLLEEERKAEMRHEMNYLEEESVEESEDDFGGNDMATLTSSMVGQASTTASMMKKKKSSPQRRLRALGGGGRGGPVPPPMRKMAAAPGSLSTASTVQVANNRVDAVQVLSSPPMVQETAPTPTPTPAPPTTSDVSQMSPITEDFTLVPKALDAKFADLDTDNSLRSTVLTAGTTWTRMRQQNLLTSPQSATLPMEAVETERNKAFDLLDAISRSGTLPVACAELHVVVAVSHCFENDVMGTVIQDNMNPIEKVEKSALIVGSTIYGQPCEELLADAAHAERLQSSFPSLFLAET